MNRYTKGIFFHFRPFSFPIFGYDKAHSTCDQTNTKEAPEFVALLMLPLKGKSLLFAKNVKRILEERFQIYFGRFIVQN